MIKLNSDQQRALHFIKNWWLSNQMYCILDGRGGTGKAHPLDEPILTPKGFVPIDNINIGDTVISEKGENTLVTNVFYHKDLTMYKVEFVDGSSVRCCGDHLWKTQTRSERKRGIFLVRKTSDMLKTFSVGYQGKLSYSYSVPLTKAINLPTKVLPISPYILGYMLGNGCSNGYTLSCHIKDYEEIIYNLGAENVRKFLHYVETNCTNITVTLDITHNYKLLGLAGKIDYQKSIPEIYKYGDINQRKELLAGLLDSDGSCWRNVPRFSTSSPQLAKGIQDLVRSLGGVATLHSRNRGIGNKDEYYINVRLDFNPFKLKRKAALYVISTRYPTNRKTIERIVPIGNMKGKCITVDNPEKLYITADYTVTHNTTLVSEVLQSLSNCTPIITSPTHEALKQLKDKIIGEYIFKTYHAALGISPIEDTKELEFTHRELPKLWENINLCILDEASMVPSWIIDILISTGVKILYLGHSSQLPPVDKRRGIFDKCLSPVFEKGYSTITLTIPQRNTGELWDFCNILDEAIYTSSRDIPNTFDITKAELRSYVHSEQGKKDFLSGDTKIVMYSNAGVDRYNHRIRRVLFGEEAILHKYLPKDKIILTKPLTIIENLERYSDKALKGLLGDKKVKTLYSNSKAEVQSCSKVNIKLNNFLDIQCFKIKVQCENELLTFYEPIHKDDWKNIETFYEHLAWQAKTQKAKVKAFQERRFILSCFAEVKGFYSATTYRLQGSTVSNIILINSDIAKVANLIEQKKHRYVGASRCKDRLMVYRGI